MTNTKQTATQTPTVKLVQCVDGQFLVSEFGPAVDLIAAMEIRGYAFLKLNANRSQRAELQGQPKFRGLNGPMWDGEGVIRYEDPSTTERLSQ